MAEQKHDPFTNPPPLPKPPDNTVSCVGCNARLGLKVGRDIHLDLETSGKTDRIKGLLRAGEGLTLACPACGTLNVIDLPHQRRMIEK